MSEDPQTTIADWVWNKINSKGTCIREGWRDWDPSQALNAAPALEGGTSSGLHHCSPDWCQIPALRLGDILHTFTSSWFSSLPKSPCVTHRQGFLWVGWQYSFGLNRNPARTEGSGGVWNCVHHSLCVMGFRQKEVATGLQVFQSMECCL